MQTTYAQKNETTQRAADNTAAAVHDNSPQSESLQRHASLANAAVQRAENPPRPNNTGLPDDLKNGVESLSGYSLDNVRVHYNSPKPATVQALAYTQGTDIHVAPGQEHALPHEAWHVTQQMAGRVTPTTNIGGMPVNDNAALEHEADVMGEKAVTQRMMDESASSLKSVDLNGESVQRMDVKSGSTRSFRDNHLLCEDGKCYGGFFDRDTPANILIRRYGYNSNIQLNSMMTLDSFEKLEEPQEGKFSTIVKAKTWSIGYGSSQGLMVNLMGESDVRLCFNKHKHACHIDEKVGKK